MAILYHLSLKPFSLLIIEQSKYNISSHVSIIVYDLLFHHISCGIDSWPFNYGKIFKKFMKQPVKEFLGQHSHRGLLSLA